MLSGLRTLWSLALPAVMAFVYVIALPRWMAAPGDDGPLGTSLVILVVVFALLASGGFSIDFRRDLERLAYLRSLPLRPAAVAVGEVFVAALLIGIASLLLLAVSAALMDWWVAPRMAALAAVVALPVAWLSVTLENWIFLLFPTRVQGDGENQSSFLGKQLIKMFFKLCVLGVVAVAAGLTAMAGGWVAGTPGAGAGGVIVVVQAGWGATRLLGRADVLPTSHTVTMQVSVEGQTLTQTVNVAAAEQSVTYVQFAVRNGQLVPTTWTSRGTTPF